MSTTQELKQSNMHGHPQVDREYPGTAVVRMYAARERARSLKPDELNDDWQAVRRRILWAAGLRDLTDVPPGAGYTGHAFNDDNHCDATCMSDDVSYNTNNGPDRVAGIALGNRLGPGIVTASDPDLGPGGSLCLRPDETSHSQKLASQQQEIASPAPGC